MIDKADMPIYLGRSLSTLEDTNYTLYLKIATQRLEDLLCVSLETTSGERTFITRENYRTVYIDPYSVLTTVKIDGNEVDADDYVKKQNDRFNGSWYNIVEFDNKQSKSQKIVVNATWGFGETPPDDLLTLLAKTFAQGTIEQTSDNSVKSKKIEDFSVTYKDSATFDEFISVNQAVIDKYSQCNQGEIRHGRVYPVYTY